MSKQKQDYFMKKDGSVNPVRTTSLGVRIKRHIPFYIMFLPAFILAVVFFYTPMIGIGLAFTEYKGIKPPVFVGLDNFKRMFSQQGFWNAFSNTIFLSIVKLLLNTFMAVVLSLMLNEVRHLHYKKLTQTIVYLPHFMSWVVTASVFGMILSPGPDGLVNAFLVKIGAINPGDEIYFLGSQKHWIPTYFAVNIWKDTGWGTILYMATLSGISPELYEAASIDGANRWQRMRNITLPALYNTIITVLILNLAKVMNLFESVFVMQNNAVLKQSDVLQTYIYTQTFNSGAIPNYGYTTAVGLVKSVVGMILVLICNYASKKVRGRGIV
jgi:putative aldouronate transport system permease protein